MDQALVIAWLMSVPGMGPKRFRRLHELIPDLSRLLTAPVATMRDMGVPPKQCEAIVAQRTRHPMQSLQDWLGRTHTRVLVHPDIDSTSTQYPPLLTQISDAPIVLYAWGKIPDWQIPAIAVVGTRQVNPYGASVTRKFTLELVHAGVMIVSGFMFGVDAIAHQTVIDTGGVTVGVLGFGFDHMYPREHSELATRVIESGGCLISEYPSWQAPSAQTFPLRNRIVSGLSLGVLVTQAASQSGSKITARLAAEQGREVFAVPGSIDSVYSEGTKELVNLGAKLVTNAADILEEFTI